MTNLLPFLFPLCFSFSAFISIPDAPSSSVGAPTSSKKSKDKSGISRSQSQRPAGNKDPPRSTPTSPKVPGDDAGVKADTRLSQDSVPDPKSQPEPASEPNVTNTQITISGPTPACGDVSPSGGSSGALQPETCDTQAGVAHEETSSPPLRQESDGGLESGPVSEPREEAESRDLTDGADEGAQTSDSIHR